MEAWFVRVPRLTLRRKGMYLQREGVTYLLTEGGHLTVSLTGVQLAGIDQ